MSQPNSWQPGSNVEKDRLEKAEKLAERGIELYPRRVQRTHTTAQAIAAFDAAGEDAAPVTVTVCGRIRRMNIRGRVAFMHIEDDSGRVQLFIRVNDVGEATYEIIKEKLIELDDFVQATGHMMRTKTGEVSVAVQEIVLLSKSLSPLPVIKQKTLDDGTVVEYGEFTDIEARYRQRYADLAVNHGVREVFRKRSRTINAIRAFLDDEEDMLEVETPILQPIYGGAAARPFTTHHNQLDQMLYLRISFELYLKRLLVGGYDAVYEIGRDFRNEGVSYKHNPEFTQIEFYKAYADYNDVMDIAERMVAYVAQKVNGTTRVHYDGHDIELAPPWRRVRLRDAIREASGIDYMAHPDAPALAEAINAISEKPLPPDTTWGRMIDILLSRFVEPNLIQPTFLIDYPRDISPFAKRVDYDDFHVERFEMFIAGMELGNAFTELNDPRDQESRFIDMAQLYAADDDEAAPMDEDYLRAMRYGMPPNGGFGMGVDRLVMLLTGQTSIRDVLLYPHMRDQK
ncbi:MAG: lysine--tRNA ligase [Anaerolineaceae bacterium]|nr:MAG: lysine--tRNA ligase [Anaerolineaceae bacterium]